MRLTLPTSHRHWLLVGLLATLALAGLTVPASAATSYDGATQQSAAASCWEIKQNNAGAADGAYWIITPQLQVPTKIYCDMTTDGGGWELIGRGRDGWTYNYNGKGTADQVASTVTGPAAFSPRQLDANTINALYGGRRVDSSSDGVRVRRATNQAGTSWQEVRWTYTSRDRWTWALGAGLPIASINLDGTTRTNTTTYDVNVDDGLKRLWTYSNVANNYVRGLNYGQNVVGTTAADSYLYSSVSGGKYASPFAQMFIRPKLMTDDVTYPSIPSTGTAAQTIKAVPKSGALTSTWGVTGTGAAGTGENATEVQAFAQIGGTMYVGGNFTTVQKGSGATGADVVSQPYLAAFNAATGDYISSFKPPVLNNQVKSLAALPDGRLAVGGEFTSVNGAARSGLVVVNATSGAVDTSWTTTLENRVSGGKVSVRGLDTGGGYLYLTGSFTHFVRGTSAVYAKNGARIALSTGVADSSWNPDFNGTGTAIDVSDDGRAVYFSGYFTTAKTATADRAAAISTASGAAQAHAWQPTFSTSGSARYQQAVKQVGGKVWLGGSQHSMFAYDPSSFALVNSNITKSGGDLQAISDGMGLVFGGCHCENWNYSDTTQYDSFNPGSTNISWSQADRIDFVGAWDASSGAYVPDFTPEMKARGGMGVWSLKVGSDETLWAGGSLVSAVKENGSNGWVGGFVRYGVRPHTAPARATALKAVLDGTNGAVSWTAPASASGLTYEVLRNDRVVATTTSTSVTVPGSAADDTFFVRTADSSGNRSASTAGVTPTQAASQPVTSTLVPAGSTWSYYFDNTATVPTTWNQRAFDASAWRSGAAPLGFGTSGPIATNIDVAAGQTRALTSYYRRAFTVPTVGAGTTYSLTTRADDGIVVYVNGTEVGRAGMPAGTVTPTTYATVATSTANAVKSPVTMQIPSSLLVAGSNSISVEVHANYRATPNVSMDLAVTAVTPR